MSAETGAHPQAASLVGETLDGRYRIIRKLGEGGMGEVYAAEHIHIEKRFAIKLLRQEIVSNPEAVQRFRQEARSSSSIGHRNIIAIEDFGQLPDGRIYMCMELLNGAALNDLIMTPQPVDRLLNILIQTGHGLAAAHAKGIVHRDMKPENVFVTIDANQQDVPKILDFGIAKVAGNEGQNNLTRTGTIFGTPFYMAPEQALGNPVDARTDIYAMGVIMYELFAGSLPFQGESFMGILTQHITTDPEPVAARAQKAGRPMPPGLPEIVMCCMQKNPAQRYSTMDELVNALIAIYRGVAGAGMSTYMEAFPVSARMPAPTPPPLTGAVPAHGSPGPTGGYYAPHQTGPAPHPSASPTGPTSAASASGLYDPSASALDVPRKSSKAGLIIVILVLLAVVGGVTAMVLRKPPPPQGPGASGAAGSGALAAAPPDAGAGTGAVKLPVGVDAPGVGSTLPVTPDAGTDVVVVFPDAADQVVITPPDAPTESAPATVSVLVRANVGSFEIWRDGKRVGKGPDMLAITPGSPVTITIKASGYKDKDVTLDGSDAKPVVKLEKKPGTVVVKPPDPTPPRLDCRTQLVNGKDKACRKQFCATHKDVYPCNME